MKYDYPIDFHVSIQQECDSGQLIGATSRGVFAMSSSFRHVSADTVEAVEYYNYPLEMMDGLYYDVIRLYKSGYGEKYILWATTSSEALLKLKVHGKNPVEGNFQIEKVYTKKEGLNTKRQQSIIEDYKGIIWIGGDKGITRFDPVNESFRLYSACDGFTSADFRENSVAISPEGELFYGTDIALVSFHPDSIELNTRVPPVKITDVFINNLSILNDSTLRDAFYTPEKSLRLNYKQNNLLFEFASLNFIHPFKNQYRYMLEGFDDTWISTGNTAHAEFFNLKPGKYVFHVKASNNDGIWNDEGASFRFLIRRPFWFSYPALLLYLIFVILTSYLYKRYIVGKAQLESEILIERHNREKAKKVDQLKSRFFTNISHEFRTPLTLVAGPLEDSLKSPGEKVSMDKKILRLMLRNARRLQRLINQLLDISKIESGSMHLQLSRGNLSAFVRTIASTFLSLAESSHIEYRISIREVEGEHCFDTDKLEKIISNLLSNAFKFTPAGRKVSLDLTFSTPEGPGKPRYALLKVSDTGKGIDKAHLDRIFDRFYQVSDNDTREEEGSGIGLALTKELVELMHGEIAVESEQGKGTSFRVTFPVAEECFSEQEIEEMERRGKVAAGDGVDAVDEVDTGGEVEVNDEIINEADTEVNAGVEKRQVYTGLADDGGVREKGGEQEREVVLVVEDNADLRMYISEQFRGSYRVIEAVNGEEGLGKAIAYIPDLVVTDIMMPVMDGVEMCRKMKDHPATNHIPVIMLTAKADKESKLTGLEAAADDYVVKPFDSELLLARAKNLVSQRKVLRRQFEKTYLLEGDTTTSASPSFQMLREVLKVFDRHLSDPDFSIHALGKELNMSRSQLFRKVHSVTGTTPNELLRLVRMKHAARLLRKGTMNISQVMYEVGMQNPSYFAASFRKYFGVTPKEFGKGIEDKDIRHPDNA
ncbi:MAG: ATP-binding protein [Bacteroidales bacterium]|nr:ATP-binding protein [Bacteroidales bacterium]